MGSISKISCICVNSFFTNGHTVFCKVSHPFFAVGYGKSFPPYIPMSFGWRFSRYWARAYKKISLKHTYRKTLVGGFINVMIIEFCLELTEPRTIFQDRHFLLLYYFIQFKVARSLLCSYFRSLILVRIILILFVI